MSFLPLVNEELLLVCKGMRKDKGIVCNVVANLLYDSTIAEKSGEVQVNYLPIT